MKITKAITKWLLGAAVASAFILAAPHAAQAQVVVQAGNYERPAVFLYQPAGYYGWRRHEYFEHQRWDAARWRHDRWERGRFYHRRYY